ncbi:MAG: multicopper oxidase family protein [Betaproteobacteria bacterium]|nr:multicopper oxidase family protein [Betaproteobacteria bacterium]
MNISRRNFLQGTGAALGMWALPPALVRAASPTSLELRAGVFRQQVMPKGPRTPVWGFNGSVPGPVLRYRRGDQVRMTVVNDLPQETTVHWHGLRIPNAMDGVPFVTQIPIPRGEKFDYAFQVPDSGTFWYHPHQSSFEQVPRGLYGALIVEEDKPIEVDREVLWVLSDFKLQPDNQHVEDFGSVRDFGGIGRIGNVVTLNGRAVGEGSGLEVRSGERIRLRILNAASARIFSLQFLGHWPVVIAFDGQAVEPHTRPSSQLVLGPGMRADLVLDCMKAPGERFSVIDNWEKTSEIAKIVYRDEKPLRTKPLGAPMELEPNALPEPDLRKANEHYILFQGGVVGEPILGMVDGKPTGIYNLLNKHGLAWTMNYTAAHEHALMHQPFLHLTKGEHVVLKMINDTDFIHPMHLHGHLFRVIAVDGKPQKYREWRDTVLMAPKETIDIAFVADNPGEWMFHCHILEHAAGGMMGTIAVE